MPDARAIAVEVLEQVQSGPNTLDHLLLKYEAKIQLLQKSDRRLLHALVFGVLRWQGRIDWIISRLTSRPQKKIDPLVKILLRLGIFQILFLDRIPDSAAVNTSVELAKKHRRKWATGFINGVLRSAVLRQDNITWPDRSRDPAAYLSVYYAFPEWLISRWIDRWGDQETEQLCDSINRVPDLTLRTNTLFATRDELLVCVQQECEAAAPAPHCPDGIVFSSPQRPIAQWPSFQQGWFQVHSEAAQCIGHMLSPEPGQSVWDACAGLGTKTGQMAMMMHNRGRILATDIVASKLGRLKSEMEWLGVGIVDAVPADLMQPIDRSVTGRYDRILLDAPCSGMGVLQRNPDGKWRNDAATIQANHHRQLALLENVAGRLKPEGLLVYAVCSFEPEENEAVVQGFLQKHPEFVIDQPRLDHVKDHEKLLTSEGFLKTFPHRHHMDGFFAAALKKRR